MSTISRIIDEELYSRQIYVLGNEAMQRLASCDVLISGLGGLGVEIAKNVILSGVHSVTLHDESECQLADLSSQFFLTEDDVGKNRAQISYTHLADLNKHVTVRIHEGVLEEEELKNFEVVIITNASIEEQLRISEITHRTDVALIVTSVRGVFAQVFCDFGDEFTVLDKNGENPVSAIIAGITRDTESVVACVEDSKHGLEDGDYVTFSDVRGMTELNGCEPIKIKVLSLDTFSIGDTTKMSPYKRGGIVHQVKLPSVVKFKSLAESFLEPIFLETDFAKNGRSNQLHLCFKSLDQFIKEKGYLPHPWFDEDTQHFLSICESMHETFERSYDLDIELLKKFAQTCSGNLCPVNAVIGGIIGQEVMKACTGMFQPIYQWLYFDAVECLPQTEPNNYYPIGSRYDGQTAIFGQHFQKVLGSFNLFLVGAGAVGCELLKNFAVMGIGAGRGTVTVTDMDIIEKSNLNRQFLHRPPDLHELKSVTAAKAVKKINPAINVVAHDNQVGIETESIYDDSFFQKIDCIATAVDNLESRIYIDRRCVYNRKPLIESGTAATKGNTQVILPFLTESYNSSSDPPEKTVPICTLKSFPNAVEHTIEWAKDIFESFFFESVYSAYLYLYNPDAFEGLLNRPGVQPVEVLASVVKALEQDRPYNFQDCVCWARNQWQDLFYNQIRQLLINFPPDQSGVGGQPFWSGPKRCPIPLVFCSDDHLHIEFVVTAANLKAITYGIPGNYSRSEIVDMIKMVMVPAFVPKTMTVELIDDLTQVGEESTTTSSVNFDDMKQKLPSPSSLLGITLIPMRFKPDDATNMHIDFVFAASKLRAANYQIPPAGKHKTKLIAGKILPVIVTSASVAAGLACLELLKLVSGIRKLELYKNGFFNLALPLFAFSEPVPARKKKYYEEEWTLWDHFEIAGEMTLREFLNYFEQEHSLIITMLTCGVCVLYSCFTNSGVVKDRLELTMSQLSEVVSKKKLEHHEKALVFELCCTDLNDTDVEVPYVKYILPRLV